MLKNYIIKFVPSLLLINLLIVTPSCQKVIELDLKNSTPQFVIEGEVSDIEGLNYVKISKTVNYNEDNNFPPVTGAAVTITDNGGNIFTLSEVSPGLYQHATLKGESGKNYILNITAQGKTFQAVSSLPYNVPLHEITVDSLSFGGDPTKYINYTIHDPAGIKNFYRIIQVIDGDTLGVISVTSDEFQDGKIITLPLFGDVDHEIKSGVHVELILQNIDEATYDYFIQLSDIIENGSSSSAPGNPTNNLNNGALGYFSAYSFDSKTIVIP